jgi:hypothetical protein
VEKRVDRRARLRRGTGVGASSPWRSRGSGQESPEGSTGGAPPDARQIRCRREEGGGGRGDAAGRLLDLRPEWSIAWPADGGSEATVTRWDQERGREKRGWVRERGVRWGKGWG